jgi:hypothetical protein
MANNYERFVAAYLRLNGYFTVPNFIVHSGDDPTRISGGAVGNYTETDVIGVRFPHSREVTGRLEIKNHDILVDGVTGKIDVVVAEAKSGNSDKPNAVWAGPNARVAAGYIARFVGLHRENELDAVAAAIASRFSFEDERCWFRYVLFADQSNRHYKEKGVSYITYRQAIEFIVSVRGQCWIESNIGVASVHSQWDDLLIDIFRVANKMQDAVESRVLEITAMLAK